MLFQNVFAVLTAVLETLCVSDIIFGWSSMVYILTGEDYFTSNCNQSNSSFHNNTSKDKICYSQQYNLELVFTMSVVVSLVASILGGLILDRFGTMVMRNVSTLLYMISCVAIAFSTPQTSWILYPAMIILATSGYFLYISNVQTANLFPKLRGTIVNVLNGALASSIVVFTLAKKAYESGISLKAIFLFMASLGFLFVLRTFFMMPKLMIPYDVSSDFRYGIKEYCSKKVDDGESEELLQNGSNDVMLDSDEKSWKSYILNSLLLSGILSIGIQWLRVNVLIESLNVWLKNIIPHDPALVSLNISVFGYVELSGFVLAPLNGAVFDLFFHYFEKKSSSNSTNSKLKALAIVCLISSCSSILYSVFVLAEILVLQYLTYIGAAVANTFPSANISLLVIQCFPMKHFGKLLGFAVCCSAIIISLQYPVFYVGIHYYKGDFFVVNIIMLCLVIVTLVHPINIFRKSRNA